MKKLNRAAVPAPRCLANLQHGRDNWDAVGSTCKGEIRRQLEKLQGRLCSYCEGGLDSLGKHVEHLWRRSRYPKQTFAWDNLFWSCDRKDSCGHFKDSSGHDDYDPADLIDPCKDDPDKFLRFRSDGRIDPALGLQPTEHRRATETLRVFNLTLDHNRSLCAERRRVLEVYKSQNPDVLAALESLSAEDRHEYIESEIAATSKQAFGTVVRHFLRD